jgi:hypothetical protein
VPRILCQPRTDRHRCLNTSQEWGAVNDDFVPSLPRVPSILSTSGLYWYLIVRLSRSKYARNSSTQCSRLGPATVGQRGVVRSRRGKMPLLISSIKSSAMPRTLSEVSLAKEASSSSCRRGSANETVNSEVGELESVREKVGLHT